MLLDAGHHLADRPPHHVGRAQAGHALEGGVDRNKPVIHRVSRLVTDQLMQGKTVHHPLEQRPVVLFNRLIAEDQHHPGDAALGVADRRGGVRDRTL